MKALGILFIGFVLVSCLPTGTVAPQSGDSTSVAVVQDSIAVDSVTIVE